jgi:Acyl-CoA carboxylase epsilon subunit
MEDTLTPQTTPATPRIAVTRGTPTPAELAAVLAVLFASAQAPATAPAGTGRPSAWARGSRLRSSLPSSGPRAWRTSAQPC